MNPNAMRGAVLVGIALLLGAMILGWGARNGDQPLATTANDDAAFATDATPVPTLAPLATATPVLASSAATIRNPSDVRVQVANAAQIDGIAGEFTARLNAQGYTTGAPTNASPSPVSTIYYQEGYELEARAIVAFFGATATQVQPLPNPAPVVDNPDTINGGANILMIVGADELSRS